MVLTNKHNLPPVMEDVIKNDGYDGTGLTVTTLLNPPHIYFLKQRHRNDVIEDVMDHFHTLMGKSVHYLFEKAGGRYLSEIRFKTTINDPRLKQPMEISGQIDNYEPSTGILTDMKVVSKHKHEVSITYEAQVNMQKYLMEDNGIYPNQLQLLHIYRDWQKRDKFDHKLPDTPIAKKNIPIWTREATHEFIVSRLLLFQNYNGEHCSEEDRWAKKTQYAVKKPTADRSRKNFDSYAEAQMNLKPGEVIETRLGGDPRCQDYCSLNNFCPFYIQKYLVKMPEEGK